MAMAMAMGSSMAMATSTSVAMAIVASPRTLLPVALSSSSSAADSPQVKICVQNLCKKAVNGDPILDNVSFQVGSGEIHGLIGPSGSGKSTVLRAINRLWEPPRSSIFVDGEDVTALDVLSLRRKVGMVFQTAYLFNGSVADNVKYGPSLQGKHLSTDEVEQLLLQAGFSDLGTNFLTKPVNELSGGEAQRVSLARTLANEPQVLLLDEPTSSLDPVSTRIVEDTVMQLKQTKKLTVIIVSHSLEQIGRLVDTATVLYQGSMLETGSFSQLKNSRNDVLLQFFEGSVS